MTALRLRAAALAHPPPERGAPSALRAQAPTPRPPAPGMGAARLGLALSAAVHAAAIGWALTAASPDAGGGAQESIVVSLVFETPAETPSPAETAAPDAPSPYPADRIAAVERPVAPGEALSPPAHAAASPPQRSASALPTLAAPFPERSDVAPAPPEPDAPEEAAAPERAPAPNPAPAERPAARAATAGQAPTPAIAEERRAPTAPAAADDAAGAPEAAQATETAERGAGAGLTNRASAGPTRSGGDARSTYARELLAHMERHKRYPAAARRAGVSGAARVAVAIGRDGGLRAARLAESSGHAALDEEALAVAARAAPYPAPPAEVTGPEFAFTVTLRFNAR